MIDLVVLGGTGDAYLICALAAAFEAHHRQPVQVVLHPKLEAVAQLFPGVRYRIDPEIVRMAETDTTFQATHDNDLFGPGPFFAHPCFIRTHVRVDALTSKPDASQADMYRMILRLPPEAPLTKPVVPEAEPLRDRVTIITESTSWPNLQPTFWPLLGAALASIGRIVDFNDPAWSLAELFQRCAASEWVIGPQCGVMSILVTGEFPCRKTLCTPSVDGNSRPDFWARETYPYGYVTKFANEDFDVEELKITDENHAAVIRSVITGPNALRLWPHDPRPVMTMMVPTTPGDVLDRLAVLVVKRQRFEVRRRAAIEREYQRLAEAARSLLSQPDMGKMFGQLIAAHLEAFDLLEREVPRALAGWRGMVHINRERVTLKNEIDKLCRAPYREVKSYWPEDHCSRRDGAEERGASRSVMLPRPPQPSQRSTRTVAVRRSTTFFRPVPAQPLHELWIGRSYEGRPDDLTTGPWHLEVTRVARPKKRRDEHDLRRRQPRQRLRRDSGAVCEPRPEA